MMQQRLFKLNRAQRTALVSVDTARAVRGVDAESIQAEIEDGSIQWAFDVAAPRSRRRELRIWGACLDDPPPGALPFEEVIWELVGTQRASFRGAEVEHLLLCSAAHVKALHKAGELRGEIIGHTRQITRESLVDFLRRRIVR
jgi:hypothetical protein